MDLVLKLAVLSLDQERKCLGHGIEKSREPDPLVPGEIAQHMRHHEILVAGMADAQAHAPVMRPDMGADRAQAVIAGMTAAELHPDLAGGKIDFIVEDGHL